MDARPGSSGRRRSSAVVGGRATPISPHRAPPTWPIRRPVSGLQTRALGAVRRPCGRVSAPPALNVRRSDHEEVDWADRGPVRPSPAACAAGPADAPWLAEGDGSLALDWAAASPTAFRGAPGTSTRARRAPRGSSSRRPSRTARPGGASRRGGRSGRRGRRATSARGSPIRRAITPRPATTAWRVWSSAAARASPRRTRSAT